MIICPTLVGAPGGFGRVKPKLWERVTRRFINGFGMQTMLSSRWDGIPLYLMPRY